MKPSIRAWFLLIFATVVFKFSLWQTAIILVGYGIAEFWDQRQAWKARERVFEDVMDGWEPSTDDPSDEEKDEWSRVRLTGQNQIIAARIAELLRRTL